MLITWPMVHELEMLTTVIDYGDGYESRVNRNTAWERADGEGGVTPYKGRNTFTLKMQCLDFAIGAQAIWSFYKQMTGSLEPFYFYNVPAERAEPDPTAEDPVGRYLVRFADTTFTREKFTLLLYNQSMKLIEVRA